MINFIVNSNLFEPPDLVLVGPLKPENNENPNCRISVVRQVNVGVSFGDDNPAV